MLKGIKETTEWVRSLNPWKSSSAGQCLEKQTRWAGATIWTENHPTIKMYKLTSITIF